MITQTRKLDPQQRAEIALYSLDQLRALYDAAAGGHDTSVRLRNDTIRRDQLAAEIRRRVRKEDRRFYLLAIMTAVAAFAGSIAAVFAVLAFMT